MISHSISLVSNAFTLTTFSYALSLYALIFTALFTFFLIYKLFSHYSLGLILWTFIPHPLSFSFHFLTLLGSLLSHSFFSLFSLNFFDLIFFIIPHFVPLGNLYMNKYYAVYTNISLKFILNIINYKCLFKFRRPLC